MRSRPIDVETDLRWRLRGRKLDELIIELDGKQHQDSLSDMARTEDLIGMGFRVIRFDNNSVRYDIDRVCAAVRAAVRVASRHPSSDPAQSAGPPSPTRGEG